MKTIVVFSGGLDSTVLLNNMIRQGREVEALSIYYGQRHDRELQAARAIAKLLNVPHQVVELPGLKTILAGSSQTSDDVEVPHGHYAAENMKITVVPNRNMILLAIATGFAISRKAQAVAYGAHKGDHAIYPDCRTDFVCQMELAIEKCDENPPSLLAPFLKMDKTAIVSMGKAEGAPIHLSYSCYEGRPNHCGKCGTCVERREAFQLAGVADPTIYET